MAHEDILLTTLESGCGNPVFSHDLRHAAYKLRFGGRDFIVSDGVNGREFDEVVGFRYERHSAFEEVEESAVFLPDGRVSYYGREGDKWFVIVGDLLDGPFDYIDIKKPVAFSPDGKHFAYTARNDWKYVVIVDGVRSEIYDSAGEPVFSSAGSVAYKAKKGNSSFMITDTFTSVYTDMEVSDMRFSPDGKRTAYAVTFDGYIFNDNALMDLKNKLPFNKVKILEKIVNRDFVAGELRENGFTEVECNTVTRMSRVIVARGFMVIDGIQRETFDSISILDFNFSPDGHRYGYKVRNGIDWFVILDGMKYGPYEFVSSVYFSPDSRRTAWKVCEDGRAFVIHDGVRSKSYDSLFCLTGFGDIVFSPDGSLIAYTVENYERDDNGNYICRWCGEGTIKDDWYEIKGETLERLKYKLPLDKLDFLKKIRNQTYSRKEFIDKLKDGNFTGEEMALIMVVYYGRYKTVTKCSQLYGNQECSKKAKKFIVVNDVETEFFNTVSEPAFSSDGTRFTYKIGVYETGKWEPVEVEVKSKVFPEGCLKLKDIPSQTVPVEIRKSFMNEASIRMNYILNKETGEMFKRSEPDTEEELNTVPGNQKWFIEIGEKLYGIYDEIYNYRITEDGEYGEYTYRTGFQVRYRRVDV